MVVPFSVQILPFYRPKPRGKRCEKIGGANAPPNSLTKPRKCSFGRVFAALVWPGGHTQLVEIPYLMIFLYFLLVFSFLLQDLTKQPLIVGFNRLIQGGFFSTGFNLSDMPKFALIP